jgi:hypothetical protein
MDTNSASPFERFESVLFFFAHVAPLSFNLKANFSFPRLLTPGASLG